MNTVFAGRATLAYVSLWVPDSEGWNPKWESRFKELYAYNPEKAKQLLKEAGYGPGSAQVRRSGRSPSRASRKARRSPTRSRIYFKNVGVNAEVEMHDWSKIRTMFRKKQIQNMHVAEHHRLAAFRPGCPQLLLQQGQQPPLRERLPREDLRRGGEVDGRQRIATS